MTGCPVVTAAIAETGMRRRLSLIGAMRLRESGPDRSVGRSAFE